MTSGGGQSYGGHGPMATANTDNNNPSSTANQHMRWSSHRHSRKYVSREDLLWDAARWFRRAWECFKAAGDVLHAAKAASALARLHLHALFVPVALFKVPYEPPGAGAGQHVLQRLESARQGGGSQQQQQPPPPATAASGPPSSTTDHDAAVAALNNTTGDGGGTSAGVPSTSASARPARPTRGGGGGGHGSASSSGGSGGGGKKEAWRSLTIDTATAEAARAAMAAVRRRTSDLALDQQQQQQAGGGRASVRARASSRSPMAAAQQAAAGPPSPTAAGGAGGAGGNKRGASLEDAETAARYALEVAVQSCVPWLLLEALLNMAELRLLHGDSFQAIAYWWEARDLFLLLFVDGPAMPLARIAPVGVVIKALSCVRRMVRFLCTCERPLVNQNLLLLDLLAVLQLDLDRLLVRVKARPPALLPSASSPHKLSHASSISSPRRPLSPPPPSSPSSAVVVPYEGPASLEPLFVFPQAKRRRDSSLRRAAQKQRGPFKLEAAALLLMPQQQQNNGQQQQSGGNGSGGGWASSSSSSLRRRSDGEYSWWTRSLKRSALLGAGLLERSASMGPAEAGGGGGGGPPQEQQQQPHQEGGGRDDEAEEEAALRACKTKTLPSRLSSSSSSLRSSMSDVFGDDTTMANNHATPSTAPPAPTGGGQGSLLAGSGGGHGSERDLSALLLPPMSRRTMAMAEHLTSVATAGTTSPPKRPASGAPSASSSSGGQDAPRSAHNHHHHRTDPSSGGAVQQQQLSVDDGSLVRQLWQSLFLVRRQCGAYSLAHASMAELRDSNRAALKTLVLQMKGLRAKTGQAPAADFTYDELLGRAQASADRAAAKELHQHHQHNHQQHQSHQAGHCACSAPQHLSLGARLLVDRLKRLVFVLQLDDGLVFSYSPHTGLRHLQRIHPPPTTTPPDASAVEAGGVRRGRASSSVGGQQQQQASSPPAHSSKRSTGGGPTTSTTSNEASSAQQPPPPCSSSSSLISPDLRSLLQEMAVEGAREKSLGGGLAKRAHILDSCFASSGSSHGGGSSGSSPSGSSGGGPRSSCSTSSSMGDFLSRVLATVAQQQQQQRQKQQAEAGAKPGGGNTDEQQQPPPPAPLPSEGTRKRSVSSSVGLPRQIMASLFGTATATAAHDASSSASAQQQAGSSGSPAVAPVPCCLTLVCSKYLHYLPWEVAVHAPPPPSAPPSADGQHQQQLLSATRYLCLHSLVNTPLEQLAAKARPASVPELFGFFWRGKEADVRARQARVGAAAVERALWELRQPPSSDPEASSSLHHPHAPTVVAAQDEHKPSRAANAPASSSSSSSSSTFRLLRRMPRLASDSLQADMWPLTTPPLSLATSSTSSGGLRLKLGRHKKRHITFFDASQAGTNLYATLSWLDSHSKDCCGHQLPVFLFSYADLARLSDALLCLLHNRPDVVALFVPPCSGDVLIKEVSARREAALAAGRKSLYSSRSRRGSTSSSTDSRSRGAGGGENVATGQRQHTGSSSSSSVKMGAPSDASSSSVSCRASSRPGRHDTPSAATAGGSSSVYEILAEAVQAVRVKHQLPVVAFNL